MVTIKNTQFTSNVALCDVLFAMNKEKMLGIIKKLDLYVSPNLKKDETARRVARELLDNPISILCQLSKAELQIVYEFEKAGPNHYITRKMRKTFYKLQNFGLVLTYEDESRNEWQMLMPDCVRESLADSYAFYLDMANKGVRGPSAKELRMRVALNHLLGKDEN